MTFRKYEFIIGLICFAISMALPSCVNAASVVSDEIEKFVSPVQEIQIDEPLQQDSSEQNQTDAEEQPIINYETSVEDEGVIQKAKPVEKQTVSEAETNIEPKQEDISVETPQPNEETPAATVTEETITAENTPQKHYISLSKLYNKCKNITKYRYSAAHFLKASFSKTKSYFEHIANYCSDETIMLKEIIVQKLSSNQFFARFFPEQAAERKPIENPRDYIPYYFLYPEQTGNFLEKIIFTDKITSPLEFLPLRYMLKNYEVKTLEAPKGVVTPEGIEDIRVLINAPSPKIEVMGKSMFAKIVVDIRNNTLYKYDKDGFPLKAYLVATGARGSRTRAGLRIVTYMEKFPYRGAPKNCKRLFDPYSYGPYILFLNAVNPKTGRQTVVDQFLHGNGNEKSIGRKVSHGCMRTNNKVMRNELSKEVKRGDYVLLINPD